MPGPSRRSPEPFFRWDMLYFIIENVMNEHGEESGKTGQAPGSQGPR